MKDMMKNAAILLIITVIAGGILGAVYEITKAPIEAAEKQSAMNAYKEVFTAADSFEEVAVEADDTTLAEGGYAATDLNGLMEAKSSSGETLGYVLILTNHEGYGGDIQFAMGVTMDGTVNGISILAISETPGLGMEADSVLKPQFAGKQVEQFEYTKTGASSENQIDAISGATITTQAVTNGVNAGLYFFQTNCNGGAVNE